MARAGDGKPRSEVRRSPYQVNVRLTAEEWNQLQAQADEWNRHLPQNASKHARMTISHLMRTAALRRKRPPSVLAVGLSAEALAEFRAARADMARLLNKRAGRVTCSGSFIHLRVEPFALLRRLARFEQWDRARSPGEAERPIPLP